MHDREIKLNLFIFLNLLFINYYLLFIIIPIFNEI